MNRVNHFVTPTGRAGLNNPLFAALKHVAFTALLAGAVAVITGAPALAIDWPLRKIFSPDISPKPNTAKPGSAKAFKDKKAGKKRGGAVSLPVVFKIELARGRKQTRLEITSTREIKVQAHVLAAPRRAVIDLPEVLFQIQAAQGSDKDGKLKDAKSGKDRLVQSFRFGLLTRGRSRIVANLGRPGLISRVSYVRVARMVHKVRVDFTPASNAAFRKAAEKGWREAMAALRASPGGKQKVVRPAGVRKAGDLPVVVLDPGHGGIDGGTRGTGGQSEKDIVFAFSRILAKTLKKSGKYKVLLTRDADIFMRLSQRVQFARLNNAQLFISIHADSLAENWVRGATVYSASEKASDARAARLAAKENKADQNAGIASPQSVPQVSDILFDLTRRETRAFSHIFANALVADWKKRARVNKNPHRSGNFMVLQAPDVPSVLLELGYLSNDIDAAKLSDPNWRAEMAVSVAAAIDSFFASRVAENTAADRSGPKSGSKADPTAAKTGSVKQPPAKSRRANSPSASTGG